MPPRRDNGNLDKRFKKNAAALYDKALKEQDPTGATSVLRGPGFKKLLENKPSALRDALKAQHVIRRKDSDSSEDTSTFEVKQYKLTFQDDNWIEEVVLDEELFSKWWAWTENMKSTTHQVDNRFQKRDFVALSKFIKNPMEASAQIKEYGFDQQVDFISFANWFLTISDFGNFATSFSEVLGQQFFQKMDGTFMLGGMTNIDGQRKTSVRHIASIFVRKWLTDANQRILNNNILPSDNSVAKIVSAHILNVDLSGLKIKATQWIIDYESGM